MRNLFERKILRDGQERAIVVPSPIAISAMALVVFCSVAVTAAVSSLSAAQVQASASAQAAPIDPAHAPGTWRKIDTYRMLDEAVTDAGFRAMSATLQRIHEVFRRVGPLTPPPDGVLVMAKPTVGKYPFWTPAQFPYRRDVVPGRYTLAFFHPQLVCTQGKCRVDIGESDAGITLFINTPHMVLERPLGESKPDAMYVAPPRIGTVAGSPVYDVGDGIVVLTKREQPLWLTMTQEEWIQNAIAQQRQQELDIKKHAIAAGLSESQVQQTYGPGFASMRQRVSQLEQELAGLSPSDRAAPAYFGGATPQGETPPPSGRSNPAAMHTRMVVRLNKDFFDSRLDSAAVQVIIVTGFFKRTDADDEQIRAYERAHPAARAEDLALFEAVRQDLDWKALYALLQ